MRTNNPFLISGYHSPEFFCDRKNETKTIISALHNGRNVTLIAPRRMGKTGLIHHSFYNIKEENSEIITLYMDILSTQNLGDFVKLFAETVLGRLDSAPQKALSRIGKFIRSIRPVFTFDELTGLPQTSIDITSANEESTLKEVFNYLASSEKRCYIAIDEFQQITEYPEKE
jgi:AAA+ ATPase superfamily predicted ATPase